MSHPMDKAMDALLELGNPGSRRTRAHLVNQALQAVVKLMEADAAVIATPWSRRGERLALHAGSVTPAALPAAESGSGVVRAFAEACEPIAVADHSDDPGIAAGDVCPGVEAGPVLFVPLRMRGLAPAYLAAYRRRGRARFTMADTRVMVLLSAWLGAALDHLRLATGASKAAVTDEVTEVYKQRFLETALQKEMRRAARYSDELSIVLIEVDHMDAFSAAHEAADVATLLRETASVLGQQVRSFDMMGRRGEAGFLVILPQTNRAGASEVGERMREAIANHAFGNGAEGTTVSLGIAAFPHDASEPADLLGAANRALTQARSKGGNCVELPKRRKAA